MKILVVEDNDVVGTFIQRVLTGLGHEVRLAGNAAAARASAEAEPPELLLTDVQLGGTSGFGLGAELRARIPALRVVYVTGHRAVDLAEMAAAEGCPAPEPDQVLSKPFGLQELAQAVDGAQPAG